MRREVFDRKMNRERETITGGRHYSAPFSVVAVCLPFIAGLIAAIVVVGNISLNTFPMPDKNCSWVAENDSFYFTVDSDYYAEYGFDVLGRAVFTAENGKTMNVGITAVYANENIKIYYFNEGEDALLQKKLLLSGTFKMNLTNNKMTVSIIEDSFGISKSEKLVINKSNAILPEAPEASSE